MCGFVSLWVLYGEGLLFLCCRWLRFSKLICVLSKSQRFRPCVTMKSLLFNVHSPVPIYASKNNSYLFCSGLRMEKIYIRGNFYFESGFVAWLNFELLYLSRNQVLFLNPTQVSTLPGPYWGYYFTWVPSSHLLRWGWGFLFHTVSDLWPHLS